MAYANRDEDRNGDRIMANTLYDVLEVIPSASAETIHAAYRSMISRYHPDRVAALGPELQAVAAARTKEINFAYDILSDAASRARYDEELHGREEEGTAPLLDGRPAAFHEGGPSAASSPPPAPSVKSPPALGAPVIRHAPRAPAAAQMRSAAAPPPRRHALATLVAAIAGIALVLALPPAANVIFGAVEFSLTGHARFFYEADNPVDARGNFAGSLYLPVLWGWLFANYVLGLVAYRLAVLAGETAAVQFGGSFADTNDRLFLFLTFVCVIAAGELFFSAHTMGNMLAGMFMLAGAYLAERGIT
jgi:curved DNA-binding protein CbpA